MTRRISIALMAATAVAVANGDARAQIIGDNVASDLQASWNTASSGTMALRSPGRVVTGARADFILRQNGIVNRTRFGPTITEVEPDNTLAQLTRARVIETLLSDFNTMLTALNLALRAGVGLPPATTPPPDTGPGGGTVPGTPPSDVTDLLGSISGPG